ncbi:MAG: hypothetical protein N3A02_02645, partial [Rectinema sp.]|nr:hypothetical protein [Rectinema sp.]
MHHHLQLVGRYEHGDRHVRSRQGTFLLFIVGIAAVLALLSAGFFAFSTGTRMAVGSMQAALYARQAAQVAVAQATYLIVSDLESSGTMPTHLDQDWRTKWLPDGAIGYAVGQEENDAKFTRPYGLEGFGVYNTVDKISIPIEAKDDIRWFTPVADSLTQFYCRVNYYRIGSYDYRSGIYYKGYLMTPGVGKYYPNFENTAGVYSYTNAPLNPDGTTMAAIWLDHRFRAVESYDRARYLVRYTANVEDLSGHLLSACTDATGNYIAGTAAKYALAAYTMGKFMERQPTAEAFRRIWMREPVAFYLDSGFWFDDYNDHEYKSKTNEPTIAKQTSPGELVQSWDVFRQIENPDAVGSEVPFGSYVLTPFGAITKKTDSPTKWYEGKTDCPWRLNLPTASAKAIMLVLMGALPAEFHQQLPMQSSGHWPWPRLVRDVPRNFKYDENSEDVALGEWNKYKHDHPSIDPTSAYVTELLDFTGGKYPGAGTWPSWSTELGKDIPLNKREMDYFGFPWQKPCPGRMPMSPLAGQWLAPYQPLW